MPLKLFYQVRGNNTCLRNATTQKNLKQWWICYLDCISAQEYISSFGETIIKEKNKKALWSLPTERKVKILPLKSSSNYKMSRTMARALSVCGCKLSFPGKNSNFNLCLSSFCNIKVCSFVLFCFVFCRMIIKVDVRPLVYIMPLFFLQHSY